MDQSPFDRSRKTCRSAPPAPAPQSSSPAPQDSAPAPVQQELQYPSEILPTSEIEDWMRRIESYLVAVCAITCETTSKLNSDQKLKIRDYCRKVAHGTGEMAVLYQSLKQKAMQAHVNLQEHKEKQVLAKRIDDLKLTIEESSKSVTGPVSFADMVKKSSNSFIQPSKVSSIAIYPTDKLKSSEETKPLVQKIIRPEIMLHVRGLRKIKNGGVVISTDSENYIEKLKKSEQLLSSGLTMDDTFKRRPRIVVIGVPSTMPEAEYFNCLFQQNLADKIPNMTLDLFLASIKLSHKSGKREAASCNYGLEFPPAIRKVLITNERVFVNWSSCPVRDFTLVTRCYKCQQYGHAAKSCREETHTCGHCGEVGHEMKDCIKKTEPPKCATCWHYKKPCIHRTGDAECPAKILAEKRYINSIDYGS